MGEPLLLLHGYSLSHKAWDKWIDELSKEYLLIIPDFRCNVLRTGISRGHNSQVTHASGLHWILLSSDISN